VDDGAEVDGSVVVGGANVVGGIVIGGGGGGGWPTVRSGGNACGWAGSGWADGGPASTIVVTAAPTSRYQTNASRYRTRVRPIFGSIIALVRSTVPDLEKWVARQQAYPRGQHRNIGVAALELDEDLGQTEGGPDRQGYDVA
jgi:hypothetical protein